MDGIGRYGAAAVGSLVLHGLVVSALLAFQAPSLEPETASADAALVVELTYFSNSNQTAEATQGASQTAAERQQPLDDPEPTATPVLSPSVVPAQKPEAPQRGRPVPVPTPQPRSTPSPDDRQQPIEPLVGGEQSTSRDDGKRAEKAASGERTAKLGPSPAASGTQQARYSLGSSQNPLPPYPWSARRRGREGRVVIRLFVNAHGHPTSAVVLVSSGVTSLDQAALGTLRHWRLEPARQLGLPIASEVDVPIRFTLR